MNFNVGKREAIIASLETATKIDALSQLGLLCLSRKVHRLVDLLIVAGMVQAEADLSVHRSGEVTMFDHSWRKVLAALEESPIAAEQFARTLFATRDSLPTEAEREALDALVSALFPYTLFGDACRHLFAHHLWGTLDAADDPISAASYYPIWLRGPHEHPQSQEEREIYKEWKLSGRCLDLAYLKRKQGELRAEPTVIGDTSRKPKYLALKLLAIRQTLDASQSRIAHLLQLQHCSRVSDYERGRHTPSLGRLLHYTRMAGIPLEHIVDDDLDLDTFRKELMLVKQARLISPTCRFW